MNNQEHADVSIAPPADMETASPQDPYCVRAVHVDHENNMKLIGWLNAIFGPLVALVGCLLLLRATTGEGGDAPESAFSAALGLIIAGSGVAGCVVGVALIRLKSWARIVLTIFYVPNLLAVPIGTIIGGCFIWILMHKKARFICSDEYKGIIAATPNIKQYRKALKKAGTKGQVPQMGNDVPYTNAA